MGRDFKLYTLIDITETNVLNRAEGFLRDQQRNYQTTIQTLSLRTQPLITKQHSTHENVNQYEFGSAYKGKHRIWSITFSVDYDSIFLTDDGNDTGLLVTDFTQVPVIVDLNETVTLMLPCFLTTGTNKNIYFNNV